MLTKTSFFTGLIAVFVLFCFSIPPANGKDPNEKATIGKLDPCLEGQVPKMQADGSWACVADVDTTYTDWNSLTNVPADIADGDDDTSAASVCDVDQVLMGGGTALTFPPTPARQRSVV